MAYDRYARGGDNPLRLDLDTLDMPKAQPAARPGAKRVAAVEPPPRPKAKKPRIDPTTPNRPMSPPPLDPDRFPSPIESTEPPVPLGPSPPPLIPTEQPVVPPMVGAAPGGVLGAIRSGVNSLAGGPSLGGADDVVPQRPTEIPTPRAAAAKPTTGSSFLDWLRGMIDRPSGLDSRGGA